MLFQRSVILFIFKGFIHILYFATMYPYFQNLYQALKEASNSQRKKSSEAYMRNQFAFLGVDTSLRRHIFKDFLKTKGKPDYDLLPMLIREMWGLERELQYCAIELATPLHKNWEPDFLVTMEWCITHQSWWDTVDQIASDWLHNYFLHFPTNKVNITRGWNQSDNRWLQRSSILFQKKMKEKTDLGLLSEYILRHAHSNEFFIQKAIGWSLREYAKTDAEWVRNFAENNYLKPLSRREALKHFKTET